MKSLSSSRYAAYDLRTYFASSPRDPISCPECGSQLNRTGVAVSKAVAKYLETATMPEHEFSSLYQCPGCKWWLVWESWGDREFWAQDFSSILVCADQNTGSASRQDMPWKQVLEDEDAYKYELPLPLRLGKIFAAGETKKIPEFHIGTKVRLASVLITYQPDWSGVNFGKKGSQGTIVDFVDLHKQYKHQLKEKLSVDESNLYLPDQAVTEEMELVRAALDGQGCYAVRIDMEDQEGVVGYFPGSQTGVIYVVAACNLEKW